PDEQKMQQMQDKAKESCIVSFRLLHSHLKTFTGTMFQNVDQLEKKLDKEEFQETGSIDAFRLLKTQFQHFIHSRFCFDDDDGQMTSKRVNERQLQTKERKVDTGKELDASLVITESSGIEFEQHDTSSRSGNDADADNADIKPVYDEEPMDEENYGSNDMIHHYYLEHARKKTQERGRNSRPSVMPSARSQCIFNGSKPKPRIINQKSRNSPASKNSYITTKTVPIAEHSRNSKIFSDSKYFVCSTCQKCVFNENHDACVTKFLNGVNSRAKVPSHKITTRYKPVEQISIAKKPERQIPTGHRFSIKKTCTMHEKTMIHRSCLRWKPTGRIFKTVSLRWVPIGKIFTSSTTKVGIEPPNGSNEDITNPYECE
ncbi:hypothetical protein Tco_0732845, partial [Tanacetum coccineum]